MHRPTRGVLLLVIAAAAPVAAGEADVVRGRLTVSHGRATVEATIAPGWHVNAHRPRDKFLIPTTLEVKPPPGVRAGDVVYPEPVERRLAVAGEEPVLLYDGTVRFTAPLEGEAAPGGPPVRASLRYQACDDTRCLPPRTLELTATAEAAARGGASDGPFFGGEHAVAAAIERWGYALTFLWVALLGLALNLTPCVYPMISVTVAFFGGRTGTDERRAVGRAILYVLGVCLTFSTLGVAAALTGSLFGAALQRPAVLGAIALLMAALALANFGLYQVRLPAGVTTWAGRTGEGAFGALFMGLTMGVVAAPCIGPIVAALLLFVGARQSAGLGFALFFALGLGMGTPYLGLAMLAGRLRRLPRAGAWLAWMERLFGFVLLGLALHFAGPLLSPAWQRVAWTLLLVVAGVVLGFLGPHGGRVLGWAKAAGGAAVVAVGLGGLLVAEAESPIGWTAFSEDALARELAGGRPVFIDFQAEWCLPCREMDRTTFRDPAVVEAANAFAMFRADVTEQDDHATALMDRFGVAGVPTYVLLGPDGRVRRRLVGFVPAADMRDAMEDLTPGAAGRHG
jgi:thiol:disulfide interchange protein DsbD